MRDFFKIFAPVSLVVGAAWYGWWHYVGTLGMCAAEQGQLGDLFGGINSIFSGLALAGIVTTIVLQSRELGLQREQLALQAKELELSRLEFQRMAEANEATAKWLEQQAKLNALGALLTGDSSILASANTLLQARAQSTGSIRQPDAERVSACESSVLQRMGKLTASLARMLPETEHQDLR